ncbi:hypothetical protein J8J27_29595, partial [Mycobacterium tuberculosis]|nr:hypothetical protein [Mycobacterium tuberculosis]
MGIEEAKGSDDGRRLPDVIPVHFKEDRAKAMAAVRAARKQPDPPKAWAEAARPKTGIVERFVEFDEVKKVFPTPKGPLT